MLGPRTNSLKVKAQPPRSQLRQQRQQPRGCHALQPPPVPQAEGSLPPHRAAPQPTRPGRGEHVLGRLGGGLDGLGARGPGNVSLSACFGCPMEGVGSQAGVLLWSQRFADLGVRGLTICDTTGMAQPRQVAAMCEVLWQRFPDLQLTLHFHNTRGMGLANVLAAVQSGIDRFDGSLGGLGGCPYAPGASGNICSEDAIHMLDAMGCDTGIDLQRLLPIARQLPAIVGREVPGQVAKSGLITDLHPAPPSVAELKKEFS